MCRLKIEDKWNQFSSFKFHVTRILQRYMWTFITTFCFTWKFCGIYGNKMFLLIYINIKNIKLKCLSTNLFTNFFLNSHVSHRLKSQLINFVTLRWLITLVLTPAKMLLFIMFRKYILKCWMNFLQNFSLSIFDIYHYVNLRCTVCWFDTFIYYNAVCHCTAR